MSGLYTNPTQPPITGLIIAGNEADRIGAAIQSLKPVVSEIIVVVNDDVTDATPAIAQQLGAKVYVEPWKGFIGQKQSATEKARTEWILNLDADETLSPELQHEIVSLFRSAESSIHFAAFTMPRLTWFAGRWIRHGDWYPDRQIRLWRRGSAVWAGAEPHAKLSVNGPVGKLRAPILHRPADDLHTVLKKTLRYAEDFVTLCEQTGRRITLLDLILRPAWRFFRSYVLRLGFLDGWQGCTIAWLGCTYTFLRYALALQRRQAKKERPVQTND